MSAFGKLYYIVIETIELLSKCFVDIHKPTVKGRQSVPKRKHWHCHSNRYQENNLIFFISGIQRELAKVKKVIEEYKAKEKKMYAKMFA